MPENLLINGYQIGNSREIFKDWTKFENQIDNLIKASADKSKSYRYRYSISSRTREKFLDLHDQIPISEIQNRDNFVSLNNAKVHQKWYETISPINDISLAMFYFREIINEFIITLYPELTNNNIEHNDSISIYEDGDFIEPHNDGENKGRVCVILLYLTSLEEYNDGGGKLIITTNSIQEEVIPIRGNYTILDFTRNNIRHEVEPVKNGFRRFCYITFIYNKDKK